MLIGWWDDDSLWYLFESKILVWKIWLETSQTLSSFFKENPFLENCPTICVHLIGGEIPLSDQVSLSRRCLEQAKSSRKLTRSLYSQLRVWVSYNIPAHASSLNDHFGAFSIQTIRSYIIFSVTFIYAVYILYYIIAFVYAHWGSSL